MRIVTGLALVAACFAAAVVLGTPPQEIAAAEEPGTLTLVVTTPSPDCPYAVPSYL